MHWLRTITLLLLTLASSAIRAQLTDDFSDGELARSPLWSGDTNRFRVVAGQLQLSAPPVAGQSMIATPSAAIFQATWEWWFELGFNPSSSNLSKVYLTSDKADLNGPLNGYFVMAGNTADEVSLYRQSGTTVLKLIDGKDGRLNFNVVRGRIRVRTDEDGNWSMEVDAGPDGPIGVYELEGRVQETSHKISGWFGVRCQYTATRSDKFNFDDLRVNGQPFPDRTPPVIDSVAVPDDQIVFIRFSEPMDPSVLHPEPYRFIGSSSLTTTVSMVDEKNFRLTIEPPLVNGVENTLKVSGVKDLAGNLLRDTILTVMHLLPFQALSRDVVITELMADPSPPEDLPEIEYVELLNRSAQAISLEGWSLTDGSSTGRFPRSVLLPGQYRVVVSSAVPVGLYPAAIRVTGMPSLNNTGDDLQLLDAAGTLIDSVSYRSGWHRPSGKSEGGWSLEIIDPEQSCDPPGNWTSSDDSSGGTPGRKNSVFANRPDLTPPAISSLEVTGASELLVTFDGRIRMESIDPTSIGLSPQSGMLVVAPASDRSVRIAVVQPFTEGVFYHLRFTGLRDCPGNIAQQLTTKFILPSPVDSLDVVVNELLFDPLPGGVDYVEVFNRTGKFLSTSGWTLGNLDDGLEVNRKIIPPRLIWPRGFMVFTADREALRLFYPSVPDSLVTEMSMPSMPDEEGSISVSAKGQVLDAVHYDRFQHGWLLRDEEGVPLERLDPEAPSDDRDNWKSAARGRGTPGAPNSCLVSGQPEEEGVSVEPQAFGPDGFTLIRYTFDEPGFMAMVRVFDLSGHLVKTLVNNENLGTAGFFRWDGDRDDGGPAGPGYYIVFAELFDDKGHVKRYRKRVVIAAG